MEDLRTFDNFEVLVFAVWGSAVSCAWSG
jgi:hypothetical protein